MSDERLRRALQAAAPPGVLDAERRAWAVVRAACEEREPTRRRWRPRPALLVPVVAAAVLVGFAVTPAGRAVVGAIRDAVRGTEAPALRSLPAPGRLLVATRDGVWVVRADGSKRRLGEYAEASWSPAGKFVAATDGRQVYAVEPDTGDVRWAVPRPRTADARWMPGSGFRVAYRSGQALRVVSGDGTGDHLLARRVAPIAPAWRPRAPLVLAFASPDGSVRLVNADSGRVIWRTRRGPPVAGLAWSADGARLAVVTAGAVRLLDAAGDAVRTVRVPGGMRATEAVFAPGGRTLALLLVGGGAGETVLLRPGAPLRVVTRSPGVLQGLSWSPDGRWLLVGWPTAGQWLFLPVARAAPVVATGVARDFEGFYPRIEGWSRSEG